MLQDPKKEAKIEEEMFYANLTPAQVYLLEIAETLQQYGWVQRFSGDVTNGFCFYGAATHVMRTRVTKDEWSSGEIPMQARVDYNAAVEKVADYLNAGDSIVGWNDHPGRTKAEVLHTIHLVALGD